MKTTTVKSTTTTTMIIKFILIGSMIMSHFHDCNHGDGSGIVVVVAAAAAASSSASSVMPPSPTTAPSSSDLSSKLTLQEEETPKKSSSSWFSNRRNARMIRLQRQKQQQQQQQEEEKKNKDNTPEKEKKEEKENDKEEKETTDKSSNEEENKTSEKSSTEEKEKKDEKSSTEEGKDTDQQPQQQQQQQASSPQTSPPGTVVFLGGPPPSQQSPPLRQAIPLGALLSSPSQTPPPPPGYPLRRISPSSPYPLDPHQQHPQQQSTTINLASLLLPLASILLRLLLLTLLTGPSIFGSDHVYTITPQQHYVFERYNDKFYKDELALQKVLWDHPPPPPPAAANQNMGVGNNGSFLGKWKWQRSLKKRRKEFLRNEQKKNQSLPNIKKKKKTKYNRTVIVLEFNPDHKAGHDDSSSSSSSSPTRFAVEQLREKITFLLHSYRHNPTLRSALSSPPQYSNNNDGEKDDDDDDDDDDKQEEEELEVVLLLESPGGSVQEYGLASDQIQRLTTEPGISLTICVDRVAASGGYMMACRSSPTKLIAAPFAVLGSIGVFRESINVHDLLKNQGIRSLIFQAGKDKVPVTTFGEITEDGVQRVQKDLNRIHEAFKDLVTAARPQILSHVDRVCTGDVFMGQEALAYGLCDDIRTSDEYIMDCIRNGDRVLKLHRYDRSKFGLKLSPLDLFLLRGLSGGGGGGGILGRLGGSCGIGGIVSGLLQRIATGGSGVLKQSSPFLKIGYTVALMKLLNGMGGKTFPSSHSSPFDDGNNNMM